MRGESRFVGRALSVVTLIETSQSSRAPRRDRSAVWLKLPAPSGTRGGARIPRLGGSKSVPPFGGRSPRGPAPIVRAGPLSGSGSRMTFRAEVAASAPDNRREHQAHATEEDTAAPCHAASSLHARRLGALGARAQHARPGRPGRQAAESLHGADYGFHARATRNLEQAPPRDEPRLRHPVLRRRRILGRCRRRRRRSARERHDHRGDLHGGGPGRGDSCRGSPCRGSSGGGSAGRGGSCRGGSRRGDAVRPREPGRAGRPG